MTKLFTINTDFLVLFNFYASFNFIEVQLRILLLEPTKRFFLFTYSNHLLIYLYF